jgi:hypothetical protein
MPSQPSTTQPLPVSSPTASRVGKVLNVLLPASSTRKAQSNESSKQHNTHIQMFQVTHKALKTPHLLHRQQKPQGREIYPSQPLDPCAEFEEKCLQGTLLGCGSSSRPIQTATTLQQQQGSPTPPPGDGQQSGQAHLARVGYCIIYHILKTSTTVPLTTIHTLFHNHSSNSSSSHLIPALHQARRVHLYRQATTVIQPRPGSGFVWPAAPTDGSQFLMAI